MSRMKRFLREVSQWMRRSKKTPTKNEGPNTSPDGQIWLCQACGKTRKVRSTFSDTSCLTWSILVYEKSIMIEDGVLITAEAVNDTEAEIGS
jgi:hypothetical protein